MNINYSCNIKFTTYANKSIYHVFRSFIKNSITQILRKTHKCALAPLAYIQITINTNCVTRSLRYTGKSILCIIHVTFKGHLETK